MSTPAAAAESAALPATPDVPSGDLDGGAHDGFSLDGGAVLGTMEELLEITGLSPEEGDAAKLAKPKAKADADANAEAKTDEAEDPDYAAIQAINQRSAARRKARREAEVARAQAAAKPVEAKPPEPAKVEPKPAEAKLTAPESEAAKAAKEVLGLIAKLAGDDQEAAAAAEDPSVKQAAERKGLVDEIKTQLESLNAASKAAATEQGKALQTKIEALEEKLGAIESARAVRDHIEARVEPIIAELPTLMGKRNATEILHTAAGKFFDKFGKFPDVAELARRIEKKLSEASPPEKNREQRTNPRKTVSSSLGSPPAARTGPDTRTKVEVEADLFKALQIE